MALWLEYEDCSSPEARVVKDFDKCVRRDSFIWNRLDQITFVCFVALSPYINKPTTYLHTTYTPPPPTKNNPRFEMIVQADEYERAQPGKDLGDFFASTQGIFQHPQVAAWDAALRAQRAARLAGGGDGGGGEGK